MAPTAYFPLGTLGQHEEDDVGRGCKACTALSLAQGVQGFAAVLASHLVPSDVSVQARLEVYLDLFAVKIAQ